MGRTVGSKNKLKRKTHAEKVCEEKKRIEELLNKNDRTPIECCEVLTFSYRKLSSLDTEYVLLQRLLEDTSVRKETMISEIKRLTTLLIDRITLA